MEFLSPSTPCKSISKKNATSGLRVADSNCRTPFQKSPRRSDTNYQTVAMSSQQSSTSYSDRFIPDRNSIDFDYCNHSLFSVGVDDEEEQDKLDPPSNKLRCEVLQATNQTPGKRMISCFDNSFDSQSPRSPSARKVSPCHFKLLSYKNLSTVSKRPDPRENPPPRRPQDIYPLVHQKF